VSVLTGLNRCTVLFSTPCDRRVRNMVGHEGMGVGDVVNSVGFQIAGHTGRPWGPNKEH
jgi:hypothetical protein